MKASVYKNTFKSLAFLAAASGMSALSAQEAEARQTCGKASWYALTSITANGERMNPAKLTAAHRSLPFGSVVKVVNRRNGRSVNVRINDRGPFIKGRVIDLSKAAAKRLGFIGAGVTNVCFHRVK